jgi:hypothetical protein
MVMKSTPAIVLGPTGNQQGTYKFLSLMTGKKIKIQQMTKYPMPDLVVKQVKKLAHRAMETFNFADRNGVLFEWNKEVDDKKDLIEEEPIAAYPLLMAEFPGIMLKGNIPMPSIEDKIKPQGRAKDAAAQNANLAPFTVAGVSDPGIIGANDDEISKYVNNNDDNIIAVANVQQANAPHNPNRSLKYMTMTALATTLPTTMLMAMMTTMTMMKTALHPSTSTPICWPMQRRPMSQTN